MFLLASSCLGTYLACVWTESCKVFHTTLNFSNRTLQTRSGPRCFYRELSNTRVRCVRVQRSFLTSCGPIQQLKHVNTGVLGG